MDPFDRPYWSRLQVELWVCTRSRDAVRLAAHAAGNTHLADLSLGPDGADDERLDDDSPLFENDAELIGAAIIKYGCVCSYDDARKQVIVASAKDELRAYRDPEVDDPHRQFFERSAVLALWPEEPVGDALGTTPTMPQGDDAADIPVASSRDHTGPKRRGGRRATWVKPLRKYLQLRLERGHDLESMSLAELRRDFVNYAMQRQIPSIPKSRDALDTQIKKALPQVIAGHKEREPRQGVAAASIDELMRVPEVRRK